MLLENPVRSYAWGSPTVIPELLGEQPTGEPQAELWVGAHPGAPSIVADDGRTLGQFIADDPAHTLGATVVDRFGARLPYLLKILAVARPLSIQAHPTISQAEQGYAAEETAGIPLDSPLRSYRDRQHKPEMVVALTEFEALLGFRDPAEVGELLAQTGGPEFADAAAQLKRGEPGLQGLVHAWLSLSGSQANVLVRALIDTARAYPEEDAYAVVNHLSAEYPDDRGLLLALLMQHVRLGPGEAAFVGAGVPHAYLSGVAVEPQASSDNTLRAGLTVKHVDTAEIGRILRVEAGGGVVIRAPERTAPGEYVYPVADVDEFRLCRLDLDEAPVQPSGHGPRLLLVVDGEARVRTGGRDDGEAGRHGETSACVLTRGRAAFVPASAGQVTVEGAGTAFSVTPNLA